MVAECTDYMVEGITCGEDAKTAVTHAAPPSHG